MQLAVPQICQALRLANLHFSVLHQLVLVTGPQQGLRLQSSKRRGSHRVSILAASSPMKHGPVTAGVQQMEYIYHETLCCDCRCTADGVYLQPLADRFARLVMQLLARYAVWLANGLSARRATVGSNMPQDSTAAPPQVSTANSGTHTAWHDTACHSMTQHGIAQHGLSVLGATVSSTMPQDALATAPQVSVAKPGTHTYCMA